MLFCSLAYRRDWWRTVRAIDAVWVLVYGEYWHCASCFYEESQDRSEVDRYRRSQEA